MAETKTKRVRLTTPPFIVMFPNLFKAHKGDLADADAAPKFGVTAVWDKSKWTAAHKVKWKAIKDALEEESQRAHKTPWIELKSDKRGIRANKKPDRANPFEFVGPDALFANLTSLQKPGVVDVNNEDIGPEEGNADLVYQGCWAQATVNVFSYDRKGSKGVALGLNNVKILISDPKKAPRRDSRKSAAEEFNEDDESEFLKNFEADEESVGGEDEY